MPKRNADEETPSTPEKRFCQESHLEPGSMDYEEEALTLLKKPEADSAFAVLHPGSSKDEQKVGVKPAAAAESSAVMSKLLGSRGKRPGSSVGGENKLGSDHDTEISACSSVSSAENEQEQSGQEPAQTLQVRQSYPTPKNFAERMMNALETGIGRDAISWVGQGRAVALNSNILKENPLLTTYFKAKDYSGFIRNCNRWGFRRVAHYNVPAGTVTYENALFQREQPHLVKHMRMDSDVQDVFARHQSSCGTVGDGTDETKDAEELIYTVKNRVRRNARRPRSVVAGVDAGPVITNDAFKKALEQAIEARSSCSVSAAPGSSARESALSKELLLRRILTLTEDYLNHPGGSLLGKDEGDGDDNESIGIAMEVVRTLGQQHQQALVSSGQLSALLGLETVTANKTSNNAAKRAAATAAAAFVPSSSAPSSSYVATLAALQGQEQINLPSFQNSTSRTSTSAVDPMSALFQSRQDQDRNLLLQQQRQQLKSAMDGLLGSPSFGLPAASSGVSQLLLQRYLQQQQEQRSTMGGPFTSSFGATGTGNGACDPKTEPVRPGYFSGDAGDYETRAQVQPSAAALVVPISNPNSGAGAAVVQQTRGAQYTSAEELLMRVLSQRSEQ